MLNRMFGVLKLDAQTFEDIEHDTNATSQAVVIVLIVSIISGVGAGVYSSVVGNGRFFGGFISSLVGALIGWLLWSAVSYFVGTTFFQGKANMGEMLRVIGFAYTPQLLSIIPCIGGVIGAIWTLAAGFVAIRQGLDLDNMKAFFTIVIGFFVYIVAVALLRAILL